MVSLSVGALVLLAACASGGGGEAGPRSEPADRDERVTATDEVFAEFDETTPGCAVGVADSDTVVYQNAYGLADIGTGELLSAEHIFDVGSVSKQITAGVIMGLVIDGAVGLDDDIRGYLPDLPDYESTVTVDDLVHHTSGLPDYIDALDIELDELSTAEDALGVLEEPNAVPWFEPGTDFDYSNSNYFLLAQIVEAVTGETLVAYAAANVFEPLEMADTSYRDDQGELIEGQAAGHVADGGEFVVVSSAWRQTGDGAVHATVGDLLTWARLFTGADPVGAFGSDEWLELMLEPRPIDDDIGYGGGLEISGSIGVQTLAHGGSWLGYSSVLLVDRGSGLAVAVACDIDDVEAEDLGQQVTAIWSRG